AAEDTIGKERRCETLVAMVVQRAIAVQQGFLNVFPDCCRHSHCGSLVFCVSARRGVNEPSGKCAATCFWNAGRARNRPNHASIAGIGGLFTSRIDQRNAMMPSGMSPTVKSLPAR